LWIIKPRQLQAPFFVTLGEPRVVLLIAVTAASLVALLLLPPISQYQSYHQFADQRTLLGIPNFWSVVSNIPFTSGRWGCANLVVIQQQSCSSSAFFYRFWFGLLSLRAKR
jgi:hypothetical protein